MATIWQLAVIYGYEGTVFDVYFAEKPSVDAIMREIRSGYNGQMKETPLLSVARRVHKTGEVCPFEGSDLNSLTLHEIELKDSK